MIYFLSISNGEYIKIGYTGQAIEKRKAALQTGNPYEIEIMHTTEGSIKEEKEIHKCLNEMFTRLKVFNNPVNEWYPGDNPIIKTFIGNVKTHGIIYALKNIRSIVRWDLKVKENEVFSIRSLEASLRKNGLSRSRAKQFIYENKIELNELLKINSNAPEKPKVILRKHGRVSCG